MGDLIRKGESFPEMNKDRRIKISASAEALLRADPKLCTQEDVQNLLRRMTSPEKENVREIKLLVNERGNLQLYVRFNTSSGEMKIHDLSFERTESGWEYRGKNF